MNAEDYFILLSSSKLTPGIFVDLELRWIDHPFAFARFKIKSDKEIEIIRRLKPGKVKVYPGRSNEGIIFSDHDDDDHEHELDEPRGRHAPQPDPDLEAQLEAKREQEKRAAALRAHRKEVTREYREKSHQIKHLTETMRDKPANAIHDLDDLADDLAGRFSSSENLLTRLVELTNKEYSDVHHTTNVTMLSLMLGSAVGMSSNDLKHMARGAMLHDIGKVRIPPAIRKKSVLSGPEQKLYEMHPSYGRQLIERVRELAPEVTDIIEHHHEYLDGSGYPHRLKGQQISRMVRIVAIVNHYDNLCNPPEISEALTPKNALARLYRDYSTRLDITLVARLVELLGIYPPGTVVQLNNERLGLVIASNADNKLQPDILIYDTDIPKEEAVIIRLSEYEDLSIEKALKSGEYPEQIYDYFGIQDRIGYLVDSKVI